ncbi:CinA family protein [Thermovibrio ammonificans]|uniref:CinA family protein n=1 Tax=Thermovibrio ammonificans TaxID=228745 RepID=UPI0002F13FDF|nr:CinA family protein [Thermovibrio ammonificans]
MAKEPVEFLLKEALLKRGLTVATAESCTGGLVAARIVNVPGSSEYFLGGVVAYHNDVKEKVLGVKRETLETYGAVSPQTAREMVKGVVKLIGSDCGVSTTGIAGPTGATKEKPVGLTYIGVKVKERVEVFKFIFTDDSPDPVKQRNRRRKKAAKKALKLLLAMVEGRL